MPFFSQIRLLPKDAVCQKKKTKKNGAACVQPRSKRIIFHFDAPVLPARAVRQLFSSLSRTALKKARLETALASPS